MVQVSIVGDRLHLDVEGWDKLWALRSRLEIPLAHIHEVRADPEAARGWWHGLKVAGSNIPGVLTAGTFYEAGEGLVFFDVHDPDRTVVLDLDHERYRKLVIEVEDPAEVVRQIRSAMGTGRA